MVISILGPFSVITTASVPLDSRQLTYRNMALQKFCHLGLSFSFNNLLAEITISLHLVPDLCKIF